MAPGLLQRRDRRRVPEAYRLVGRLDATDLLFVEKATEAIKPEWLLSICKREYRIEEHFNKMSFDQPSSSLAQI